METTTQEAPATNESPPSDLLKTGNSESGVHTRHFVVRENRMVFWREDRDRKGHLLAALATYTGKRNSGQKSARVRNVATRQLHANHQARVGDSKRPLHNDPVSQPFGLQELAGGFADAWKATKR